MKLVKIVFAAAALAAGCSGAQAQTTVLTFEGVGNLAAVNNFYNGGTDSQGNSGVNYGISFSSTSLGLVDSDAGGTGNFANEPSPSTVLFFQSGGAATMNVAAGFSTGFSFFYASDSTNAGNVTVFDGLNATGNVLATLSLTPNGGACVGDPAGTPFCNFSNFGVAFGGVADRIAFDNVTLGSAVAGTGAVPEPATWAMMIGGFGVVGGALRRQRKVKTTVRFA